MSDEPKLEYPRDFKSNIQFRAELLQHCATNETLKACVKALFYQNIEFAFDVIFWTYSPKEHPEQPQRPFILYDYQRGVVKEICEAIESGWDQGYDKSRDMGMSWLIACVFLWYWLKPDPGNDFLLGSRKEDLVDKKGDMATLLEKCRYNLYKLPPFLLPEGFQKGKNDLFMHLQNPLTGASIRGESNNASFGAGGRYKAVLFDEYARWEHTDELAWISASDATKCKIPISTPWDTGVNCHFWKLKESGKMKFRSIHWKLHPDKDEAWYEDQKSKRSLVDIAQNLDINYEIAAGTPHFPEYNPLIHRRKLVPIKDVIVWRLWDFGYNSPFVKFCQIDQYDNWLWLHCIMGRQVELDLFSDYVIRKGYKWFLHNRFDDISDPAGIAKSDKEGAKSSIDLLNAKGIFPQLGVGSKERMTLIIRNKLLNHTYNSIIINEEEPDEPKGFIETESMYYFHRGFQGGLTTHDTKKGQWKKDGYFDHGFDAAGYGALVLFPYFKEDERLKRKDPYATTTKTKGSWMSA